MSWICLIACLIFFLSTCAATVGGFVFLVRAQGRAQANKWQEDAQLLGLTYIHRKVRGVQGRYRGRRMRVHRTRRRDRSLMAPKSRYLLFTIVEVTFDAPSPRALLIMPQDAQTSVSKLLGGQDIEVGHRRFDRAFCVRSSDADAARNYLCRGGVIDAFGRLYQLSETLFLRDNHLRLEVKRERHGQELQALLDAIAEAVAVIDRPVESTRFEPS